MLKHLVLCSLVAVPFASASPPPEDARTVVETALVEPLRARELHRSRYSRASPIPLTRRVRVLDDTPRTDAKGKAFMSFALDARQGRLDIGLRKERDAAKEWTLGTHTGCVYPASGEVFVKVGPEVFPAALLLGKRVKPAAAHVCQPGEQLARK